MNDRQKGIEAAVSVQIKRARRGGLLAFTLLTKPDYEVNWHHKLTTHYLNRFIKREIKRLIILEPPRYGKSELSSRRLPALLHGLYPNDEILAASYNGDLASDMTIDVQRILDTETYQKIFPCSKITPSSSKGAYARSSVEHELIPITDDNKLWRPDGTIFDRSNGYLYPRGSYRAAGVGGSFTGRGGNWMLIDDPIKNREDADSPTFRDALWRFYTSTIRTRLEKDASILITLTHWHQDDLVGRLEKLSKINPDADQWTILRLPAIKESEDPLDPRQIGEPLWPNKFPLDSLKSTRASIGIRDWSALYQQRPTAEGGNIIQRKWFKFYDVIPSDFQEVLISGDFATKDKTTSDFTSIQVWGRKMAHKFLLYRIKGRWDFPNSCHRLIETCRMFPKAYKKLIEAKANGPAIVQTLKEQVPGLVEIEPLGDKTARLNAVAPDIESGNVWIPNPENNPWVEEFISEVCDFPTAPHDDDVDAMTQAILNMRKSGPTFAPIAGHGSGFIFEPSLS